MKRWALAILLLAAFAGGAEAAASDDPRAVARAAQEQICARVMQLRTSHAALRKAVEIAKADLAKAQAGGDATAIATAKTHLATATANLETIGRQLCAAEMSYEASVKQAHATYCTIGGRTC